MTTTDLTPQQLGGNWLLKAEADYDSAPSGTDYTAYAKAVMVCAKGDGEISAPERDWILGFFAALGFTCKNQSLCMSGATSGASCGRTVDYKYSEVCGKDIYGSQECYSNLVSAGQRVDSSRHGDSGGPVFELTGGDAQVRAMGTVTGSITKDWIITKGQWLLQEFATAVRDFPGLEPALDLGPDPV
ncbi:hypothetical protein [Nonomuraea sp. NPDC001699]